MKSAWQRSRNRSKGGLELAQDIIGAVKGTVVGAWAVAACDLEVMALDSCYATTARATGS